MVLYLHDLNFFMGVNVFVPVSVLINIMSIGFICGKDTRVTLLSTSCLGKCH